MKKIIFVFTVISVCLVSIFFKNGLKTYDSIKLASNSQSSSSINSINMIQSTVTNDIDNYYNKNKDTHTRKVSINNEILSEKAKLITKYKKSLDAWEKNNNISNVYNSAVKKVGDNSGVANILTGYIKTKWEIDALFTSANQSTANLTVNEKINGETVTKYFKYKLSSKPVADFSTSFLSNSREVKDRVESLILLYQVTKEKKYLAALKKEIVEAARWDNHWQSCQYIDTAELAYAVSLGYDYTYGALSKGERNAIENRLLEAVLLYGTKQSSDALTRRKGNFNQVGNSGAGIAALTLIESSNEGELRVLSMDSKSITISYPAKKNGSNNTIEYDYKTTLWYNKQTAQITDPTLYSLLKSKIKTDGNKKYIRLRDYYSAVITKTIKYLPEVMKSDNMYIDGSYPEGKDYYLFGMRYFSYYIATLENTLHKDYGLLNFEGNTSQSKKMLNNIVLNPVYISNSKGENINYGDARKKTNGLEDDLFYLTNLNAKNGYKESAKVIYDYKKRTSHIWDFYSIMWYDEQYDAKKNKVDYDKVFNEAIYKSDLVKETVKGNNNKKIAVISFRSSYTDSNATFIAMRGGTTKDHHNHGHLDLGTYVFDAMGINWVVDSGSEYNSKNYFEDKYLRWQYYVTRAEAHSTIVVNNPKPVNTDTKGNCLASDQYINAVTKYTKINSSENSGYAVLNLTDAYNKEDNDNTTKVVTNGNKVYRGIKLFNDKKIVLVQDKVHLEKLTTFYSIININSNVEIKINNNHEATLTDSKTKKKVKVVLKSDNNNVRLTTISQVTSGKGVLNDFILKPSNNKLVNLELNQKKVSMNKLVVYLHNKDKKDVDMTVGVFYIPDPDKNKINEKDLKLVDLNSWSMPSKPEITIYNNNNIIKNNDTIVGDAIIKINNKKEKKKNEIIKYSLDFGKTWYKYDSNDVNDIKRRTISSVGLNKLNVLATLDDGSGIESDTTKISISFKIEKQNSSNQKPENSNETSNGNKIEKEDETIYDVSSIDDTIEEQKEDITIEVKEGETFSKKDLKKIKESGKKVNLIKYKETNEMYYSISIDSNKINDKSDIKIDSLVTIENKGKFDDNNEEEKGIYVDFNTKNIPKGSKFKINLSDKFNDNDSINIYTYDNNKVKLVNKSINTNDGILEFDLTDSSKYFITTASLKETINGFNIFKILEYLGLTVLLIVIGGFFIKKSMNYNPKEYNFYG